MNWFEDQIKNRTRNDADDFSEAFRELSSIVMGEAAAKAGLVTPRQKTRNAVQEILKFFDEDIIPVPDSVEDTEEYIAYCLKPSGIMKRQVELTSHWWRDAFGPMLGTLKSGETVALLPTGKGYQYYDYALQKYIVMNAGSAENIRGHAYCFYKPFPSRALSAADFVKYMFGTITKGDAAFYLTIMAVTTLMGLIQPRLSLLLYDYVIPAGDVDVLMAMGALLISMALAAQALGLSRGLIMTRLTMRLSNTVEPAVMMRMLALPAGFFKKYAAGELSRKLSLIPAICGSLFSVITGTLLTSLFSLAYFTQIASITPALLLPSLVIIGANLALNIMITLTSIRIQRRSIEAGADLSGLTYAMLAGIQKIKLTGSEKRVFARWAAKYKAAVNFAYNPPAFIKYAGVIGSVFSAAGLAVVYFIAITTGMSVGDYMAYNVAYGMVAASVLSLGSLTTFYSGLKPQLDIVAPLLKAVPETGEGKTVVTSLSGGVEVNNLTFKYEESGMNILDGINFKIRPGQYVALVGKTGCGKSTLIRLLLGFENPDKGAIFFDGKDLSKLDLTSLRRKIGTVTQNGKLFSGDIYSNIVISSPRLTLDDAWEAARVAGLAAEIEEMPMGMHTIITEGGGGISGGQKQRLMIARAVAPKPKILILDESTSALDNITQKQVTDALAALKCTRIVVAHRLSTIKECDRIYVLDGGKIIEEGDFAELYARKGAFHELVSRQMIGETV